MKPVNYGVTKYPELQGLHGKEYRNAWNKIHRERMREVGNRFRKTEKGKLGKRLQHLRTRHSPQRKRRRRVYNTNANNKSRKLATMSHERWGPVEDALLYSGISHKNLVPILGRSILAIQLRKVRLKKMDAEDPTNQA